MKVLQITIIKLLFNNQNIIKMIFQVNRNTFLVLLTSSHVFSLYCSYTVSSHLMLHADRFLETVTLSKSIYNETNLTIGELL